METHLMELIEPWLALNNSFIRFIIFATLVEDLETLVVSK